MAIKKVGVLGCGLMGSGIAQVSATAGFDVISLEVEQKYIERGFAGIRKSLDEAGREGQAGRICGRDFRAPEGDDAKGRPRGLRHHRRSHHRKPGREAEDVRRARSHREARGDFREQYIFDFDHGNDDGDPASRPLCGSAFFQSRAADELVEVARTIVTSDEVFETVCEFGRKLGKIPVRTNDQPGFIVNRLLVPYLMDAIRAFEEGVGSVSDIDASMKLGCGYPMGPFTLLDFVGLDTTYYITNVMFDEFKEKRFASPSLLKRMVMAGWHGKKSGKGFYDWSDPNAPVPQDAALRGL